MFSTLRRRITRDFLEVKLWINSVPADGSNSEFQATSYGLFFVYIYGIYDSIVKQIVSITIDELNHAGVNIDSCIFDLYSLLFSQEYDSLYDVGREKKWEKRWEISRKLAQNPIISIPPTAFPTDGRNIKIGQLESLKNSFGINKPVLPRPEIGHYIQEMVDHRNHIAHGDFLPKEVGGSYTKTDVLNCCNVIAEVCDYLCDIYEEYLVDKKYLR